MSTYDMRQIEKPLKVCPKCQRQWYMLADVCMECRDPYTHSGDGRTQSEDVYADVQGNPITGP